MSVKKPHVQTDWLVRLYTAEHLTLRQIGAVAGMSAQAVQARLRSVKVEASEGEWVAGQCAFCGEPVRRPRSRSRRRIRMFCSNAHYYAALAATHYVGWRHGQRLARAIVAQHFDLEPAHVVHHKDGDDRHNDLVNLAVYASQAEHMAAHRGREVSPLWDGAHAGDPARPRPA